MKRVKEWCKECVEHDQEGYAKVRTCLMCYQTMFEMEMTDEPPNFEKVK